MKLLTGTSGYSYKEWKGSFYPDDLAQKGMLAYYASRLPIVEINSTFYRLPKASVLEGWAEQVPETFRFSIKASQRITHHKRLKEADDETGYLLQTVRVLGERLGPVLFQLPPNFKKSMERLESFLGLLPRDLRCVFEFRHESWQDDEVYDSLRGAGCAICLSDTDEAPDPPLIPTTDWGYVRLRREAYQTADLERWLASLQGTGWADAYVFFKHEDGGTGPRLASELLSIAGTL